MKPMPNPNLSVVPEHISLARRSGATIGIIRQRNYCVWAILSPAGELITNPSNADFNPGNRELALSIEQALTSLGSFDTVYCLEYKLEGILAHGDLNLTTVHTAPPTGARQKIERELIARSHKLCDNITLYTDASKGAGATIGTGWVITYRNGPSPILNSGTHTLPANSATAELLAIRDGLNNIMSTHRQQLQYAPLRVTVSSDSQDALKKLDGIIDGSFQGNHGHPMLRDAFNDLRKISKELAISTQWVKGHSGNPGNETADRLAVNARRVLEFNTPPEVARNLFNTIITESKDLMGGQVSHSRKQP